MHHTEKAMSERAAWWALILLTATYTFSFVDRQIINLLVDPIRADLSLSDSEVSFLQGLAFVMPYVLLSIPIGLNGNVVIGNNGCNFNSLHYSG